MNSPTLPDWNDLRYFLEVARAGKLAVAAEKLEVENSTVSRRIDRLEAHLGSVLFDRHRNGYSITEAGLALMPHAEAMENAVFGALEQSFGERSKEVAGRLRVGSSEGFGVCVLAPRLAQLRKEHPLLQVELMAQPQFPSLVTREVEVLVTLDRPEVGRYVVTKLVDINYYFYASRRYLDLHPPIRSLVDLEGHQFVDYVHEPSMSQRLRYLEEVVPNANRSFTSTSILAQRDAAAAGLGIVLLTPYCVIDRPELAQVLAGQSQVTRTFWLAAPEDLYRIKRVRVIFDFLRSLVEKEPALFTLNEPQGRD